MTAEREPADRRDLEGAASEASAARPSETRIDEIRAGLKAHRADWDCTGENCEEYDCGIVAELLAALAAARQEAETLRALLVDATYLMQHFNENDAAYKGWREKSKEALRHDV